MQINPKSLPAEMKEIKDHEPNSWILSTEDQSHVILKSYVVKTKSSDMRYVLLFQLNVSHCITKDEKKSTHV